MYNNNTFCDRRSGLGRDLYRDVHIRCALLGCDCDAQRRKRRVIRLLGRLLRPARAGTRRSALAAPAFAAPELITVSSPTFNHGGVIPAMHAGDGVGDNVSPRLHWRGVPADAKQLVLIMEDVDVPLPKPLLHSIAVLEPTAAGLAQGDFRTDTPDLRTIATLLGNTGYRGPRPVPGHGPHHYRFHVFALDQRVPGDITSAKGLLGAMAGHVIARGVLTGSYER
jgi:Raf kinase inhibitor-like YbhB/YbcL family protein